MMIKLFLIPLLFTVCLCDECKQLSGNKNACLCETNSGFKVDLKQIEFDDFTKVVGSRRTKDKADYKYNACEGFSSGNCKGMSVCQKATNGEFYNAGSPLKANTNPFSGDPSKTLTVQYTSDNRTSLVYFKCSTNGDKFEPLGESKKYHYEFRVETKVLCEHKRGLSTGSILCILLVVFLFVYFVGGFLFLRFVQGARGIEQVPHVDFWKELPLLVWDGVVFLKNGCKTATVYDQI